MHKLFTTLLLCGLTATMAHSQNTTEFPGAPTTQPYGKVDVADLELKACDFEKDANAMVLFDKANIKIEPGEGITMYRHTRIKIFNDFGKAEANIRLTYNTTANTPYIVDVEGETINLENGKQLITKLDKKLVYKEQTDKFHSAAVFTLPNVQSGSIIEYKYTWHLGYYPNWYFQNKIPTRYSEIQADLPPAFGGIIKLIPHLSQPYVVDVGKSTDYKQIKALANIHSLPDEVYMDARRDNLQRLDFLSQRDVFSTWEKIGKIVLTIPTIGDQINVGVAGERDIIKAAQRLKTDDEKIAYVFGEVKKHMKWNNVLSFYTIDGTARAWEKGVGNSTEINFALYRLLKKAGIQALPMLISTRKNGLINPLNPSVDLFNSFIVCVPLGNDKYYALDASDKYNLFNAIPLDYLNSYGLTLDESNNEYKMVFLQNEEPAIQAIYLNAEVKPGGKLSGDVQITSYSYNKSEALRMYKTDGEEKYINYLKTKENGLKISSLKMEDMDTDSLPLAQKIKFECDLTGSDENYTFLNTNPFNLMGKNPFINENRYSNIDFGYLNNYSLNCSYKLPPGYKIETLPKNIVMNMPDSSAMFKRTIVEQNSALSIRCVIMRKKALYFLQDYADLRLFYQKLYEFLNEQIVLKKA